MVGWVWCLGWPVPSHSVTDEGSQCDRSGQSFVLLRSSNPKMWQDCGAAHGRWLGTRRVCQAVTGVAVCQSDSEVTRCLPYGGYQTSCSTQT